MTSQHVQSLRTARDSMVAVRRRLPGQIGSYMQPAEYASNFATIQGGIEAIDRAIADEESERAMLCGKPVMGRNASTPAYPLAG
jgi:hypothetical protein